MKMINEHHVFEDWLFLFHFRPVSPPFIYIYIIFIYIYRFFPTAIFFVDLRVFFFSYLRRSRATAGDFKHFGS